MIIDIIYVQTPIKKCFLHNILMHKFVHCDWDDKRHETGQNMRERKQHEIEQIMKHNDSYFICSYYANMSIYHLQEMCMLFFCDRRKSAIKLCNKSKMFCDRLKKRKREISAINRVASLISWSLHSFFKPNDNQTDRPHLAKFSWQIPARAYFIANLLTSSWNFFIRKVFSSCER